MLLPTACPVCARPGPAPCHRCRAHVGAPPALPAPPGLTGLVAVMAYEGAGREIVARLKYRNARDAVPWLAERMAAGAAGSAVSVVSWVPTTPARRRHRGFDQARVLAVAVARRLELPCRSLLRRRGPAQTGRTRVQRLAGPAFELAVPRVPPGVLLVDDVVTTGATLAAAAERLRHGGATEVLAVVAARRP